MKELLTILNSKPLGMFPWKAEKMAEILYKTDKDSYSFVEILAFQLWQKYTKNFVGEEVKQEYIQDSMPKTDWEIDIEIGAFVLPKVYQEVKLLPEHIWAGEEPKPETFDLGNPDDSGVRAYNDYLDAFNQRKEDLLFDVEDKGNGMQTWVTETTYRENCSPHDFHVQTNSPFSPNVIKMLIQ